MSLSTAYYLSIEPAKDFVEIDQALQKLVGRTVRATAWSQGWSGQSEWLTYAEDLTQLSRQFPETFFVLEGVDLLDNSFEAWRCYAKNGKTVDASANIVYPEFREGDLK
jgi:hypothetical protein